jgi:hypothetical protein
MNDQRSNVRNPKLDRRPRWWSYPAFAIALILLGAGCETHKGALRNLRDFGLPKDGSEQPFESTIGVDKDKAPAGQVIETKGFGVDLI